MTTTADWEENLVGRLAAFVEVWRNFQGTEQAGAQQFLQSLMEIYEVSAKPGTVFEQHPVRVLAANTASQGSLFATETAPQYTSDRMDLYLPKVCVWEMKAPGEKKLEKHHDQVLGYWARMRTRYMVLCNFHEFWIYDTDEEGGQLAPKLQFTLEELPGRGDALLFLRGETPDLARRSERVTAEVASVMGRLVRELIAASAATAQDRERIAKFVLECVFAMFAEDTELCPPGLFSEALGKAEKIGMLDPVWTLFDDFGRKDPGDRSNRAAPYVNGPLFDRNHPKLALTTAQVHQLYWAAKNFDWQDVRPEVFGSIFEQSFNVVERHELGAHFTHESDIARVLGPTVIEPWQQRIAAIRTPKDAARVIQQMRAFHVLDPACGCGNFLYVAYREMKRLEAALAARWTHVHRHVAKRSSDVPPPPARPYFTLEQVHGIEVNGFAAFLARVVLWIGEHLARRELALEGETLPLRNLDGTVRHADALFTAWPRPDGELAIVGNPPYLGVRKLRRDLGDEYVERLFEKFPHNRAADFVTCWFTQALNTLKPGERAGFVCTNSIAQNESREASLDRVVAAGGTLTDAWRSYDWPGDAAVHVAIANWVMAPWDGIRTLDGKEVLAITPGLTAGVDASVARHLSGNEDLCFMGVTPGNSDFVLDAAQREAILAEDPASAVVIRPYLVGRDVNREVDQAPTRWVIDFGTLAKADAEKFPGAMRHVRKFVYGTKQAEGDRKSDAEKLRWWQFVRPRPDLRRAIHGLDHVLVMPCATVHLIVSRQPTTACFDHQLMVAALPDWYHFGILQSRQHEVWALARGSSIRQFLRYTNTTIFETLPFPLHPGGKYDPRTRPATRQAANLAAAAEAFDELRSATCRARGLGLTKIHNDLEAGKPADLRAAWEAMNDAVDACYGFAAGTWRDDGELLARVLALNAQVAAAQAMGSAPLLERADLATPE